MKTHPHPKLLPTLFAYKSEVELIFNDVLGLHEIDHIAIGRLDPLGQWLIFSSTPSLEFNLFSTELWSFDNSYSYEWMVKQERAAWPSLYKKERHTQLYYSKQLKTHLAHGLSLSIAKGSEYYLYSFAGSTLDPNIITKKDLLKIGDYCLNSLQHLFLQANTSA